MWYLHGKKKIIHRFHSKRFWLDLLLMPKRGNPDCSGKGCQFCIILGCHILDFFFFVSSIHSSLYSLDEPRILNWRKPCFILFIHFKCLCLLLNPCFIDVPRVKLHSICSISIHLVNRCLNFNLSINCLSCLGFAVQRND